MANPFFSGRIPKDLLDRVEQHVKETGFSKTDILINALAAYLNHPVIRSSPATANPEIEERFKSIENRITAIELEVLLNKSADKDVISLDNNKLEETVIFDNDDNKTDIKTTIPKKEESLENFDNRFDNKPQIEAIPIEEIVNDNVDNINDNKGSETEDQTHLAEEVQQPGTIRNFESLSSVEFAQTSGIERRFLDDQRVKVRNKYRKLGKQIPEKQLLEQPELIPFKKEPLLINNYPYNLFFLGQDENGNNLWTAIPFDNNSYQALSLANPRLSFE